MSSQTTPGPGGSTDSPTPADGGTGSADQGLLDAKRKDLTHFVEGLTTLAEHVVGARSLSHQVQALPRQIRGVVVQPDGAPAPGVSVTAMFSPRVVTGKSVMTDAVGVFRLPVPTGLPDQDRRRVVGHGLDLVVRGEGDHVEVMTVGVASAAIGEVRLATRLDPLPRSVAAALVDLVDDMDLAVPTRRDEEPPGTTIKLRLGEDACNIHFDEDKTQRRYPYRVLVRLVEPRATTEDVAFVPMVPPIASGVTTTVVDRVPIDRPLSVAKFRNDIIGNENGTIKETRRVPMAGTLGIGYVLNLAQSWKFEGLSLGNLLYSLPLAPGEQQRIAISEHIATAAVREQELLDDVERQRAALRQDASTQAIFESAFQETVEANSSYNNTSTSSSTAGSFGLGGSVAAGVVGLVGGVGVSSGVGRSTNSGTVTSRLDGARHYSSHAAENLHSSVERESASRRRIGRTSIRLATETDRATVTTKVITNQNRAHALTLQYWEVLRHFRITSEVEGVTLVCFVPLDVIRFLPPERALALNLDAVRTRKEVIDRYGLLHRHADAIQRWLPNRHREGLRLLDDFIADPRSEPAIPAEGQPASNVINFRLRGTFLPLERVYVSARLRTGGALGPVLLDSPTEAIEPKTPTDGSPRPDAFATRADLIRHLQEKRKNARTDGRGALFVPADVDLSEIVAFEITRRFDAFDYQLKWEDVTEVPFSTLVPGAAIPPISSIPGAGDLFAHLLVSTRRKVFEDVHLSPAELEALLGGPRVDHFNAELNGSEEMNAAQTLPSELPPAPLPLPARDRRAVLTLHEILKIERTLQHVLRNMLTYSKAVWSSLTPEERVVLLEGFTIGLPDNEGDGQADDASQNIPLLNCVANEVVGFYGNCMIMPFSIPPALAEDLGGKRDEAREKFPDLRPEPSSRIALEIPARVIGPGALSAEEDRPPPKEGLVSTEPLTTGEVQEALAEFHRRAFSPPVSHVSLPTRGVLGEAVLGHCPAAEKIDLTRFWNWQDSPIDKAADVSLPQPLNAGALTAPNVATTIPPIVNNVNTGDVPTVGTLAKALADAGAGQKGFDSEFTGLDVLKDLGGKATETAEKARQDALGKATQLATEAMKSAVELRKLRQAEEKKAADQKATDEKKAADQKATDEKKAADQKGADAARGESAVKTLKDNSEALLAAAEGQQNQAKADELAERVVSEAFGGAVIPGFAARLFPVFDKRDRKAPGGRPQGSTAFLRALGLIT